MNQIDRPEVMPTKRRIVGAKRACVLRRRGESVWYDHTLPSGKNRYSWPGRRDKAAQVTP